MKRLVINITISLLAIFSPAAVQAAVQADKNAAVLDYPLYDPRDYGTKCAAAGTPGTALTGSDHVTAAYNFLISKGLTAEQASGVIGNMILESGIAPQRLEGTGLNTITPYNTISATYPTDGWGLVQWTPHTKIGDSVQAAGKDPNDMGAQLDFLWEQLNTTESNALVQLKATSTPDDAALNFATNYERPRADALAASAAERQTNAIAVFMFATQKTPIPDNIAANISTTPLVSTPASPGIDVTASPAATDSNGCPASTGTGGSTIAGYKNPFRDWPGIVPYRIDSGVDYDGQSGPIYSIGNATVVYISRSPDYAYNYLIYKFTDGPAVGLSVYISEQCDFPASLHVGDAITADTVVCNYLPSNPVIGIEIGWSSMPTGSYNVSWNNTVTGGGGTTTSNAGLDMNRLLVKLGAPSGIDYHNGPGDTPPPPASWPIW